MQKRIPDDAWLDVLAEMKNQHANGADTFIVLADGERPTVKSANEQASHTARSGDD